VRVVVLALCEKFIDPSKSRRRINISTDRIRSNYYDQSWNYSIFSEVDYAWKTNLVKTLYVKPLECWRSVHDLQRLRHKSYRHSRVRANYLRPLPHSLSCVPAIFLLPHEPHFQTYMTRVASKTRAGVKINRFSCLKHITREFFRTGTKCTALSNAYNAYFSICNAQYWLALSWFLGKTINWMTRLITCPGYTAFALPSIVSIDTVGIGQQTALSDRQTAVLS